MPADLPWLTITLLLPLVGVPVLLLVPGLGDRVARGIGLVATLATFGFSLGVLANFDRGANGYQLVDDVSWVRALHLRYAVGVDGISLFLVLLTTFLFVIAVVASFREVRSVRLLMATILGLETFVLGCFLSLDLLMFFLFFEATLFPAYFLIAGWGGERRAGAAIKFFIYTMAGSAFLFVAVLVVFFQLHTFDVRQLQASAGSLSVDTARWLFLAFLVAFAVKAPLVPLHAWQPDAYTESPTGGLLILAGVLPKIATYGLLRFNLGLFPEAAHAFKDLVSILALAGIVYGAIVAIMQTDLKRLVAYSSISHVGFIVLGLFAFTQQGLSGSVLYMVNHALSTGLLFVLVGMLYERTRTRDVTRMGGIQQVTPKMAAAFLIVGLASMGLPGLNNFVSEFLVILGTFASNKAFGAIAAAGILLSAVYFLWAYQRTMHGPVRTEHAATRDLSRMEYAVIVPVMVVILFLGLYPKPVLDRVNPATCRAAAVVVHDLNAGTSTVGCPQADGSLGHEGVTFLRPAASRDGG